MQKFSAIPTMYAGVQMRSRLEAKWACFFDLCGWHWSYEPIDGDGWIPDFQLGEARTLVEIGPLVTLEEWQVKISKITKANPKREVLLLGCDPLMYGESTCTDDGPQVGWVLGYGVEDGKEIYGTWPCNFGLTEGNDKLGLANMHGAWANFVWCAHGEYDPRDQGHKWENGSRPNKGARVHDSIGELKVYDVFRSMWTQASNRVQWERNTTPAQLDQMWKGKRVEPKSDATPISDLVKKILEDLE